MSGRPGFLGGLRTADAADRDGFSGFDSNILGDQPVIRLGDSEAPRAENGFGTPGFDPVWGTLGAPVAPSQDDWAARSEDGLDGVPVDVEVFGNGFQVSGRIYTGQFPRLSDWINMQSGFIQVHDAWHAHLGQVSTPEPDMRRGTLWVRLNQVVLVAERNPIQQVRPGAPVVQKQRRQVAIVTPGYNLKGSIHVVAYGSMTQFLESPDPHFLPLTDMTVHWLSDPAMVAKFPFAMVNREQLVTVLDQSTPQGGGSSGTSEKGDEDSPLHRQWGAA
jgi:hypothetical protein